MNIAQLLEILEDYDPNLEVRIAIQPNWPFQCSVDSVVKATLEDTFPHGEDKDIVYIGCGSQIHDSPYLPLEAKEALNW